MMRTPREEPMTDYVPPVPPLSGDPDPARTGPAWEADGSWFSRFAQTTQALLVSPGAFFSTMRREGGLGEPVAFGVIGSVLGGVVSAVYNLLLSTTMAGLQGPSAAREQAFVGMFSTGCVILVLPILTVLSMFIGAGIYHLMLMLLGGARRPFETTLRVAAYSNGATSVLNLVPICGGFAAAIYAIVANIIGLAKAHEIGTGKAAAAVLLPLVACCVIGIVVYAAFFAMIVGGMMGAARP
jgi:hypothetical protein